MICLPSLSVHHIRIGRLYSLICLLIDMQTFALYTIFSIPISIWEFFALCFTIQVVLQFGTACPNISTNINVNFHNPRDYLISYNSMQNQIFIPWTSRNKTSLLFSNVMISWLAPRPWKDAAFIWSILHHVVAMNAWRARIFEEATEWCPCCTLHTWAFAHYGGSKLSSLKVLF
jgi:hypothetical protein